MHLLRPVIHAYLRLAYLLGKACGTGVFGPNGARPAIRPGADCANRLKAALFQHHVKQFNEAACSVATVVTVINAIRHVRGYRGATVGQEEILETVPTTHWKERMQGHGYKGRRGLPLALLGQVVQDSLDAYGIAYQTVVAVPAAKPATAASRKTATELRARLKRFDTRGDCLVIAHFNQGALLPTLALPHISPVGGYDSQKDAVTILDVDWDQSHYQVSFDNFYRAIASHYQHMFRPFGYGRGGYVYIRLS